MSGPFNSRRPVGEFRVLETGLSSMGDMLLYEFSPDAPHEDLDREKSALSGDTDLRDLINEELPDSMFFITKV